MGLFNRTFNKIMKLDISEYDKARIIASFSSILVDKEDILSDNLTIAEDRSMGNMFSDYDYIKESSNVKIIILSLNTVRQRERMIHLYRHNGSSPFEWCFDFNECDRLDIFLSLYREDEDKLSFNYKKNDENKMIVAMRLNSEDKKIEILKSIHNKLYRARIVASLSSNEIKFEELKKQKEDYNKALIIGSLSISDDEKIELMEREGIKENKTLVIKELLSDRKKLKLIEENLREYNIAQIIGSLSVSDREKIVLFEKYNNGIFDSSCVDLIVTLKSDKKKFYLIDKMRDYEKENNISNYREIGFNGETNNDSQIEFISIREEILNHVDGIGFSNNYSKNSIEKADSHMIEDIDSQQTKLDKEIERQSLIAKIKEKSNTLKSLREQTSNIENKRDTNNKYGWIRVE